MFLINLQFGFFLLYFLIIVYYDIWRPANPLKAFILCYKSFYVPGALMDIGVVNQPGYPLFSV